MKKALSLVEVIVAIVLLTIIIATVLQIQQNNIFFLEKFKNSSLYNSYISLVVEPSNSLRDESFYLSDKVDLKDDDIRKEFKNIKISVKDTEDEEIDIPQNDYIKEAKVVKSTYLIDGQATKTFYTFKLQ